MEVPVKRRKGFSDAKEPPASVEGRNADDAPKAEDMVIELADHPRVITVAGRIDFEMVGKVANQLAGLNAESGNPIIVQFSSGGGHLQSGWALHDLFGTNASPVLTAGFGYVGSAATVAFMGGAVRFLSPTAKLMIHLVGFSTDGDTSFDLADIRKRLKKMSELQSDIERFLARRSGQPLAKIRAWCAKETEFSARQAVKAGFADKVLRLRRPPPPRRR